MNPPKEMPKFKPIPQKWTKLLADLKVREYIEFQGEIADRSIQAACRRNSKDGKRFCLHVENGIRTVWRVL